MFKDLIDYEGLDEACEVCEECFIFSCVTFKRDFGPWKKGQHVDSLWFMLEDAIVEEQDSEGVIGARCKFQLTALPS